jgi:hypothetical protein
VDLEAQRVATRTLLRSDEAAHHDGLTRGPYNFLYRFQGGPPGRSRRRLGGLVFAHADAPTPPGLNAGWREGTRTGPQNPRESPSRGGFDTRPPRGGSIGPMRSTWEGRPIAGKRTAAAPVSNPPLCRIRNERVAVPAKNGLTKNRDAVGCSGAVRSQPAELCLP